MPECPCCCGFCPFLFSKLAAANAFSVPGSRSENYVSGVKTPMGQDYRKYGAELLWLFGDVFVIFGSGHD